MTAATPGNPTDVTPIVKFINDNLQSNATITDLKSQLQTVMTNYQADESAIQNMLALIAATPPQPAPAASIP